jgi:uncharacterized protein YchJ
MRSRYKVFVLGFEDCLLANWHPSTRPQELELAGSTRRWLGLKVLRHEAGTAASAIVEFIAAIKRPAARTNCTKRTGLSVKAGGGSTLTEMPIEVQPAALHR